MGNEHDPGLIARRLEWLFETVRKADGSVYSNEEVAKGAEELGYHVTANALWKIRRGMTQNPVAATLQALAAFFQVNPSIFFEGVGEDRALLRELEEAYPGDPLVREIARKAARLTPDRQAAILTILSFMVPEKPGGQSSADRAPA